MKTQYDLQAEDFLNSTGSVLTIDFLKSGKHFEDDKEVRDIYKITLSRGQRNYVFNFGNSLKESSFKIINKAGRVLRSFNVPDNIRDYCIKKGFYKHSFLLPFPISASEKIVNPTKPTDYDILACLTKYDPGTFENFCGGFGYSEDSIAAKKIYFAVCDEFKSLCTLYSDEEMRSLSEIN